MVSNLERLWTDRCDVTVQEGSVDQQTGRTVFEERTVYADVPCRLSFRLTFENVSAVKNAGGAFQVSQAGKLFVGLDVSVPPGARITVRRGDRVYEFARSGAPAIYSGHQELRVERFRDWA